jgi:hypothetical protein
MSAPRSTDRCAPSHRRNLPRQRKSLRLEMRPSVYAKLMSRLKDGESVIAGVERLILESAGCPEQRTEYVHKGMQRLKSVA